MSPSFISITNDFILTVFIGISSEMSNKENDTVLPRHYIAMHYITEHFIPYHALTIVFLLLLGTFYRSRFIIHDDGTLDK